MTAVLGLVIERLDDQADDRPAAVLDRRHHARTRGDPAHDRVRRRQSQPAQPGDPLGRSTASTSATRSSPGRTSPSTSQQRSRSWRSSSSSAPGWASPCGPSPSTKKRRWHRASRSGKVFAVAWGARARRWRCLPACSARCAARERCRSAPASPALALPCPAGGHPRRARLGQRRARRRPADRRAPRCSPASTWPQYTNTLGNGYSLIVPYVVMLIVLLVRPYGLFGTPEIRRV